MKLTHQLISLILTYGLAGTCMAQSPTGAKAAAKNTPSINPTKIDGKVRAKQLKDLEWGMFVCWSYSTFYGKEWTPTRKRGPEFFKATGCDTDQWARRGV